MQCSQTNILVCSDVSGNIKSVFIFWKQVIFRSQELTFRKGSQSIRIRFTRAINLTSINPSSVKVDLSSEGLIRVKGRSHEGELLISCAIWVKEPITLRNWNWYRFSIGKACQSNVMVKELTPDGEHHVSVLLAQL